MAAQNDIEEVVKALEDGTDEERVEAIGELANLSREQPSVLVPYLDDICSLARDDDPNIRSRVARILMNISRYDTDVVIPHIPVIRTLLMDDYPYVVSFATSTATEIANASPETLLEVTDRLFELLTYENPQASGPARSTRAKAVLALGYLVDANSTLAARLDEPLAERLTDDESMVRAATVTTLTQLGLVEPDAVSTALVHLPARLDDPDRETQRHAVDAYVYFRHKQPAAIVHPDKVAPALKAAAKRVDLNSEEEEKVTETYQYIDEIVANGG